ncbi:MAG: cation diffusion facilitator family transporter [Nostoc sp. DedVER02]|uniref:cation diffusion facilitator family transporter n=1 Tax=unclassified Nostoc TaxID=2593658 RepID=UPI002AD50698|nr:MULTISPECIES: cation diffusion facilitator family transporter [unclassified Nostoc]MDZ7989806.1 cation diffusion facilitator family transporter [Nostoc sp. DedVER02]MDZ8113361.1 cation diffusion facilitator family transporter [Nostoc sp. DedVER01b]
MSFTNQKLQRSHHSYTKTVDYTQKLNLLWVIFGLRSSLFLIELGVGLWGGSLSLLAGSGHLFSDVVTLGLTVLVVWLTERQSSVETNFKYQQIEAWIGLLNGVSLVTLAGFIALEAVERLQNPQPVSGLPMLAVATLSIVINSLTIHPLHKYSHHDLNLRGVLLHGIADAGSSLGVILAAGCVYFFNWLWADAVASLLVALFLSISAISLIQDSLRQFQLTCKL